MRIQTCTVMVLSGWMALAALGRDVAKTASPATSPPDKEKLSYAQGMRIGLQATQAGPDLDLDAVVQGLKDSLEGKPTVIQEAEIAPLFRQAKAYQLSQQATKDSGPASALLTQAATQNVPAGPPDKHKLCYAMGMRAGLQLKHVGADLDAEVVAQAFLDVLQEKPTRLTEPEAERVFVQARDYGLAQQSEKNQGAGQRFLAEHAKAPGIKVLPDGLQYRILHGGAGAVPTTNDLLFIKYRGSFVDGREFDHNDHFLTRSNGGPKAWQEALQRMKVGDKWELVVPPALAFGHEGEPVHNVGPDATLVYELELLAVAQPGDPGVGTGRIGYGLSGERASTDLAQ